MHAMNLDELSFPLQFTTLQSSALEELPHFFPSNPVPDNLIPLTMRLNWLPSGYLTVRHEKSPCY
jgi:hypothetical protein